MTSTATLIAEAKAALAAADAADEREVDARQLASDARWTAAERMTALSDGGMGHREIAVAIGVGHTTVDRYVSLIRKGAPARGQLFGEAMRELRSGWGHEPTSIEGKAKAVAAYVKDPEVFADPKVIAAVSAAQRNHSEAKLPPKPVQAKAPPAGLLGAQAHQRADYWTKLGWQIESCRKAIDDAVTEIHRSGLPDRGGAELIRQLRRLFGSVAKAEAALTSAGIGESSA